MSFSQAKNYIILFYLLVSILCRRFLNIFCYLYFSIIVKFVMNKEIMMMESIRKWSIQNTGTWLNHSPFC